MYRIKLFFMDFALMVAYRICDAFIMSEMDMSEHYSDDTLNAISHFHSGIRNHFTKEPSKPMEAKEI